MLIFPRCGERVFPALLLRQNLGYSRVHYAMRTNAAKTVTQTFNRLAIAAVATGMNAAGKTRTR